MYRVCGALDSFNVIRLFSQVIVVVYFIVAGSNDIDLFNKSGKIKKKHQYYNIINDKVEYVKDFGTKALLFCRCPWLDITADDKVKELLYGNNFSICAPVKK